MVGEVAVGGADGVKGGGGRRGDDREPDGGRDCGSGGPNGRRGKGWQEQEGKMAVTGVVGAGGG